MNAQANDGDVEDLYDLFGDEASDSDKSDSESSTSSDSSELIDPQAQLLEDLESHLNSLTLEAETILSRQSRSTQLILASETKNLFKQYEQYGSMARLKVGIEKYLHLGDEEGRVQIEDDNNEKNSEYAVVRPGQSNRPAHYGEAFMLNYTEDDDKSKFDAKTSFINPPLKDRSAAESDAYHHPLRIIDPDSIPYVTTLAWDPIATKIKWPAHLDWPKGLLSSINKILSIVDHESRVRLFHHVTKYGPSPVFRLGISEHVKSQYSTIFQTAEENYLGLTTETRSFLRGIYYKKQHLNIAERRILALACQVAEDSVEIFWEDMADSLRGYEAMRIFMAAREIEKNKEAKKQAEEARKFKEEKRKQEVMKEHVARFNELKSGRRTDPDELLRMRTSLRSRGAHLDDEGFLRMEEGRDKDEGPDITKPEEENNMSAGMSGRSEAI